MFLGFLTENEKKAFLALAHKVAMADDILHKNEEEMLKLYEQECGISLVEIEKNSDVATLCSIFTNKQTKIYCLVELLALALSDAKYEQEEQNLMERISVQFNIDSTTMHYLKHWITRQNAMVVEITEFAGLE